MKKNKKSLLFSIFLIICTHSAFTIKKDRPHKAPDLRCQKNTSLQTARYTKKIATPSYRDWKRHFHAPQIELTGKQRLFFSACMLTLLGQSVIGCLPPQVQTSQVKDVIYSKPYYPPHTPFSGSIEEKTFGSCEKLPDNATLCRTIGSNYTVTSCIHPSASEWHQSKANLERWGNIIPWLKPLLQPLIDYEIIDYRPVSRCLSYNLDGIGHQSESPKVDLKTVYRDASKICSEGPHKIAQEVAAALRNPECQQSYYFSDNSYPNITLPAFGSTGPVESFFFHDRNEQDRPCLGIGVPIEKKYLPTLARIVENLDINAKVNPLIVVINDEACNPTIKHQTARFARLKSTTTARDATTSSTIYVTSSMLQSRSDTEIASVMAHELHHQKQFNRRNIRLDYINENQEAEADLASLLATGEPCLSTFLEPEPKRYTRSFPQLTTENTATRLAGQSDEDPHPKDIMRQSLALIMWERDKEATELLIADHEKRKK